jgi:LPS export ABC transporter permease LptF/LPS export ABC transporter permease LptG
MRILTRYILKEISSPSILGLVIFTFLIFVPQIGRLLEMVVRHSLPFSSILTLFLLPLPGILVMTVPMAVLVGVLIGLSRMSADGEVIAARATGIGLSQFVRPVMIFALAGWAVASVMSLALAPQALRQLRRMEQRFRASEAPHEIQPRVFLEQFPNLLLYLQDVIGSRSEWRGVFIADSTQGGAPKITLAERGVLVNDRNSPRLTLHLEHGTTHEIDLQHPERYSIVSFTDTDIPIPLDQGVAAREEHPAPARLSLTDLVRSTQDPKERQAALVELHYRLALPVASLVLALVGIPLGIFTRKGGRAVGVMTTVALVFVYYILMAFGLSFSKQGRLQPAIGLWVANAVFGIAGILMLTHIRRVRLRLQFIQEWFEELVRGWQHRRRLREQRKHQNPQEEILHPRSTGERFFLILDLYILRGWFFYFAILLVTFVGIYMIFDFFQLLSDIVRNRIGVGIVLDYYRFLAPQVIYLMLPLSVLVATLVNFGILTKTNQVTALKSAGISIYRASAPVLVVAGLLSAGMFVLEDTYLPRTNQRQDALRNTIKGKPAQTYYRPDRQWIFGQTSHIYHYLFFDPDDNTFGQLSIFEFDEATFQLKRRIYATRAFWESPIRGWVLINGWVREFEGDRVTNYMPFSVATFREFQEEPGYFKKEVKPSAQMSAWELRAYTNELAQSGFDVARLLVQFYRKFSFPLIAFVVTLIGIPFALTTGRKGAISGIALSITIALLYWSLSSLFEAMGNLHQLPPLVAAWSPDVFFGLGGAYLLLRVRT